MDYMWYTNGIKWCPQDCVQLYAISIYMYNLVITINNVTFILKNTTNLLDFLSVKDLYNFILSS